MSVSMKLLLHTQQLSTFTVIMSGKVELLGFFVISPKYLTWNYIREILVGNKKLMKTADLNLEDIPPKCVKQTQNIQCESADDYRSSK